jgi:uncharacterized membrane protein
MIKSWTREITLAIQARSGASPTLFVCVAVTALATLTAFVFLCIAGYDWFAIQFGSVFAALLMTAIFAVVAIIAAVVGTTARQRARERAILERAARACRLRASRSKATDAGGPGQPLGRLAAGRSRRTVGIHGRAMAARISRTPPAGPVVGIAGNPAVRSGNYLRISSVSGLSR